MKKAPRFALLACGAVALLAGLDAALLLLGLPAPVTTERLPAVHGGLLVLGFVGSLVALERAVALRAWWGFVAPAGLGVGGVLLVGPAPLGVARGLLVLGAAGLVAVYAALWRRQPAGAIGLQALGAVLALGAALLWWADAPVPLLLPWFAGFVVLTIAGERVELARVGAVSTADEGRAIALGLSLTAAVVATALWPTAGHVALGAAVLGLVAWLAVHDVARRTVRATGLPRFVAWCLLGGYAWLGVAGAAWLLGGPLTDGPGYDAVVHAVFLGFTLSMIMAHAPVILPAVLGVVLPYHPVTYVPVVLLHGSLALRVVGGDAHGLPWALTLGGALNIASVLLFALVAVGSAVRATRARSRRARTDGPQAARRRAVAPVQVPEDAPGDPRRTVPVPVLAAPEVRP